MSTVLILLALFCYLMGAALFGAIVVNEGKLGEIPLPVIALMTVAWPICTLLGLVTALLDRPRVSGTPEKEQAE